MRIAKNYAVIKVQCERFNSTYARLNPALGFESRISKYISGLKLFDWQKYTPCSIMI
jgi:hypothetical protein